MECGRGGERALRVTLLKRKTKDPWWTRATTFGIEAPTTTHAAVQGGEILGLDPGRLEVGWESRVDQRGEGQR